MLKNIPPILSPDLMRVLMEMGHGDEIVLADGNFPAASTAKRLVRCDGHGVPPLLEALLAFFPAVAIFRSCRTRWRTTGPPHTSSPCCRSSHCGSRACS